MNSWYGFDELLEGKKIMCYSFGSNLSTKLQMRKKTLSAEFYNTKKLSEDMRVPVVQNNPIL
jgi:hypothetical protein